MKFFLGTHKPHWLWNPAFRGVPLFVSIRRLRDAAEWKRAETELAIDSSGFTELSMFGRWQTDARTYAAEVRRARGEIGRIVWAAQQDWMCEPQMLKKTGKTVMEHQRLTVANYLELRSIAPECPWVPVVQGYSLNDYQRHADEWQRAGVELDKLPTVGVGSVCRRQNSNEGAAIVTAMQALGLKVHAFGFKVEGVRRCATKLTSSDSLAWSRGARFVPPLAGCPHKTCSNCARYALKWRQAVLRAAQ